VTNVVRAAPPTLRPARELKQFRWIASILAVVAVCIGTVAISPRPSAAVGLSSERAQATTLLNQINTINGQVERLGQKYDAAQIKLKRIQNEIVNTKAVVAGIQGKLDKGNLQLRADAVFAYVTNGSSARGNPLFNSNAATAGATNVYNQLAEGNIATTLANLKNYRIKLTKERSLLAAEDAQAAAATRGAAGSFHSAKLLQAKLKNTLAQVKGQIATFIAQAQAAAAAKDASTLQTASPSGSSFPAPPPNSRANIAVNAALTYIGVWYSWGGASRSGVDCSGLVMLAYDAAGISLSHYSGAQWNETMRVPLYNIQPGDILFYGYHGDEHEAMYVGHGQMIEAETTGTRVHIVPVRLGYGFTGLGRPRG
jgi:cell wall-associated NlpC family hydrolase